MKYHNQIWTEEETNLLKKHWKDYNQRELKEKFFPKIFLENFNDLQKFYSKIEARMYIY